MNLYTLGHSNLSLEKFNSILSQHDITWIVDVRSSPYSARVPQFNRRTLTKSLRNTGVSYLFLGDKLGGKPRDTSALKDWAQGKLNYALVSELSNSNEWRDGIEYLSGVVKTMSDVGRTGCLLCSEADVNNCHRSLVAFQTHERVPDLSVVHLGADGARIEDARFQKSLFRVAEREGHYH